MQSVEDCVEIDNCKNQLLELVHKKEVLWKQRSKCMWLKAWDHNSRFFHAMATSRRRNNLVSKIRYDKGCCQEKEEDISKVFLSYFK